MQLSECLLLFGGLLLACSPVSAYLVDDTGMPAPFGIIPDANRTLREIIESKGYPCEVHMAQTADGYLLPVYRIPPKQGTVSRGAVFLQHGLEDIGATWFLNLANQSLGFILADAGYDVYAGNNRGTDWTSHISLDPNSDAFWDFSYDEFAQFDLPAQVELALAVSGTKRLSYIGHSQGTFQSC